MEAAAKAAGGAAEGWLTGSSAAEAGTGKVDRGQWRRQRLERQQDFGYQDQQMEGYAKKTADWTTQAIGQQHTSPLRAGCEARRREIVVIFGCGNGLACDAPEEELQWEARSLLGNQQLRIVPSP